MSPQKRRRPAPSVTNTASGHSTIGVQGIVYGDVRYEVKGGDSPDRKFAVAKNCLAGDMPRRAEELIQEVVAEGYVSNAKPGPLANEVAYHWTIAVLSDRSFELLGNEEFADLERARSLAANGPRDEWHEAHAVVIKLVDCLHEHERTGSHPSERLDTCFTEFDRLAQDRREEIWRHLDLILTGVLQDGLDARFAGLVRTRRTGDNRENRVWKFFEPEPARPRPITIRDPVLEPFPRTMAISGAVMGGAGLVLAFILVALGSVKATLIAGALIIVFGALVICFGPPSLPARYSPFPPKPPRSKQPRPRPVAFSDHVNRTVQWEFDKRAPKAHFQRSAWNVATRRSRATLADEIIELYSRPEVAPGAIDWLIAWYAKDAARKWSAGGLKDSPRLLRMSALVLGATGLGIGWLVALSTMTEVQPGIAGVALLWLAAGVGLIAVSRADVYLVGRCTYAAKQAAAERRLARETKAYEERCALLADRPDDTDMVRWLDYDKIYLKTLAMNQYGLTNRDVIAHAILTEAAPNCRRARFRNGPPRFSAYNIWIFLLTASGVRQVTVKLDFPTGIASDQQRTAFRYDAIASAQVREFGFRFDDGRREIILPGTGDRKPDPDPSALIFYQVFQLSLTNGQGIDITVENLDEWIHRRPHHGPDSSPTWTPDTSDLTGALQILEAVAADGSDWIAQARERRRRRLHSSLDAQAADGPSATPHRETSVPTDGHTARTLRGTSNPRERPIRRTER
jgi:hypothetical protein